jgi:methionyl-tRNA formyltransferase
LRIVMLGTGDFALPTFRHLLDAGFTVVALVTQPERPQGRKHELIISPIKQQALDCGIPVFQPENVNDAESIERIRSFSPDVLVTAAYGQILSSELLSVPPLGGVNLHGSILPAYRGAAPVARAIQHGETESGITVIQMSARVDAGGILAIARAPIEPDETAGQLEAKLARLGAPLVAETLRKLATGTITPLPQDRARVSKAPRLSKDDGRIDWSRPALEIHNLVRAMNPWPLACTHWFPCDPAKPPQRLIVRQTRLCGESGEAGRVIVRTKDRLVVGAGVGSVELVTIQAPGKKPMPISEYLRGHRIEVGDRFGEPENLP